MIWAVPSRSPARALVISAYVLAVEVMRTVVMRAPGAVVPALILGGAALMLIALGIPAQRLGLGTSRLPLRIVGGLALGAVLLLPARSRCRLVRRLPFAERCLRPSRTWEERRWRSSAAPSSGRSPTHSHTRPSVWAQSPLRAWCLPCGDGPVAIWSGRSWATSSPISPCEEARADGRRRDHLCVRG